MFWNEYRQSNDIAAKGLSFDIIRCTQLFPPKEILNSFWQCGIDDAASEVTIQWERATLCERFGFYAAMLLYNDLLVGDNLLSYRPPALETWLPPGSRPFHLNR